MTPPTNEPDRCIHLKIPNEGRFSVTRDIAELWLESIKRQRAEIDAEIEDNDQLPMDEMHPTPAVGMD